MTRTPDEAVIFAHDWATSGKVFGIGRCLDFAHTCYDIPPKYGDAAEGWAHTQRRGTGPIPRGAFVWWLGGSEKHGHVAIAADAQHVYSTDFGATKYYGDGRVRLIPISSVAAQSSNVLVEWSWDCNDVEANMFTAEEENFLKAVVAGLKDLGIGTTATVRSVVKASVKESTSHPTNPDGSAQHSGGSGPHTHQVTGTAQ